MCELLNLVMHPFVIDVLEKGEAAQRLLGGSRVRVDPDYLREPDEHEFFLIGVAHCVVEVIVSCQQLSQIPVYLTNHRQTKAMGKTEINRHSAR